MGYERPNSGPKKKKKMYCSKENKNPGKWGYQKSLLD